MSSLTNQTSSTKSMSGLSDTYSTNIVCDTFQCDLQFTISPGCVISLPNNSIPDAALSTNVALLNRNPQTFTGVNNFNADTNQNAIQYFVSTGGNGTRTRMTQSNNGLEIVNQNNTQFIQIVSRTAAGASVEGLRVTNGNTVYIQGNLNNRVSIIGSTPPVITIAPPAGSNNFSIANTAWVNTAVTTALLPYALLAGPQTFTNTQNFNGQVKCNDTFVSNLVGTGYANQFFGDVYCYRAFTCQNGLFVQNQITPGATTYLSIDPTGNLQTIGNINAASLTLPANSIPDSYLSSNVVLDADLLNYVALAGSQTITGFKQFTTRPIFQQGIQANQNIVCESIGGGGQQSIIVQDNAGLNILNVANSNSINLQTRTSGGVNVVNLSCANGTTTTINGTLLMNNNDIRCKDVGGGASTTQMYQSGTAFAITPIHNSSSVSLWSKTAGGVSVENIKCQNGTQNLVRGSINMLNEGIVFNDVGLGPNSTSMYQSGITCTITNNYNSGSVRLNTKTAGGVAQDGVYARDGNVAGLQGNSNKTIEVNGNDCTIACDNFRSNAPFECGYLQLGTPITTKTNYDIGYRWTIAGTAFTSWAGYASPNAGNVYTLAWDGSGDRKLGVWNVEISVGTWSTATDLETLIVWNTISTTSKQANYTSAMCKGTADFFLVSLNIVKLNFVLNVTNLTTTYYLNYMRRLGAGIVTDTDSSFMTFTRIA